MRNLKKVLSLALAMVMLIGMMVVGAGAVVTDFRDDADINADNKEAVLVMNALGILEGYDDGSFGAEGTLNRAEAAKILAYVHAGATVADALGQTQTKFTDVPANEWYSGYVAYCANMDIIAGSSATTFDPKGTLTAMQFAKMLLVAMGGDSTKYVGDAWATNTMRDAVTAKLNDKARLGLWNDPITRDQASQMAFNGMTNTLDGGKMVYPVVKAADKSVVGTFDTLIEATLYMSALNNGSTTYSVGEGYRDTTGTLGKKNYDLEQKASTDAFGRATKIWSAKGDVKVVIDSAAPTVTYTTGDVTEATVKKDTGASTSTVDGTKVWINGKQQSAGNWDIATNDANGKVIEVYASNKTINKVVVIERSVGTLTADPATRTNSAGKDQVRVPGVLGWTDTDKITGWEDLAKGDVVLYVKNKDGKYDIEKADSVTGVVSGFNATKGVQVDGVYYAKTGLTTGVSFTGSVWANNWSGGYKDEYTFYLDAGESVVAFVKGDGTNTSTESSYAVVQDVAWFPGSGFTPNGYMQAKILKTDGTYETINVASVDGVVPVDAGILIEKVTKNGFFVAPTTQTLASVSSTTASQGTTTAISTGTSAVSAGQYVVTTEAAETSASGDKIKGRFFGANNTNLTTGNTAIIVLDQFYELVATSEDNTYALKNVTGTTLAGNIVKGQPKFDNTTDGNANTVFIFTDKDGKNAVIYTGIADVPSTSGLSATTGKAIVTKNNVAQFVYVKNGVSSVTNTSTDMVYIVNADTTVTAGGQIVDAFVNGEPTTITLDSKATVAAGLYPVKSVDSKGVTTLGSAVSMKTGIKSNSGNVFAVKSGDSYRWDDDTKVYVIEGTGDKATCTELGGTSIEADGNDLIYVITNNAVDRSLAATVYLVKVDAPVPEVKIENGTSGNMTGMPTGDKAKLTSGSTTKLTVGTTNTFKLTTSASFTNFNTTTKLTKNEIDTTFTNGGEISAAAKDKYVLTISVKDNFSQNVETYTYTIEVAAKDA